MGTVWSGLSLLMAFAIVAGLMLLLRSTNASRYRRSRRLAPGSGSPVSPSYTTLGYAFTWTMGTTLFLVSGLIGYRLGRRDALFASTRWSADYIWDQIWIGLAMACLAAWFWRKGLREIRSNVHIPELAGHDAAAPPSRRIERR